MRHLRAVYESQLFPTLVSFSYAVVNSYYSFYVGNNNIYQSDGSNPCSYVLENNFLFS